MSEQLYCVLDYETRSEADLKKVGGFEYSVHPSTRILCAAWRVGTRKTLHSNPTHIWTPALPDHQEHFGELLRALRDPSVKIVAHNAFFEQVITRNVLGPRYMASKPELQTIPVSRWICTAASAAALAIPRHLAGAGSALGLRVQKDTEGHKLMMKMCKPRKPTKGDPSKWHNSKKDLLRLMQYCVTDVDTEVELFLRIPGLNPTERKVWELDQKINFTGFRVDRDLVKTTLGMIERETKLLNDETLDTSGLMSTNQRAATLAWLESQGVFLPDLKKKTVEDALAAGLADGAAKRLLEIRQGVSKTSTAKYLAFEQRSRFDGRCRDILTYHTASTGRWGGAGVQPQNFPRGTIKNTSEAADVLASGDLEWVRMLYADPMSVFSSCLRSMIIPSDGNEFVCADYATIEVRVLFWLAENTEGLEMFHEGKDIYRHMASVIYNRPVESIANPSDERNLGKGVVLGCGFGMGKKKFFATCKQNGMEVTEDLAALAVSAYRSAHGPVVEMWGNLERAAIKAVQAHKQGKPGTRYRINKCTWFVEGKFLYCELPSGRRLAYYGPEIRYEETPWGEPRPVLYHWGVDSMTKQWVCAGTYGGKLTENVVQATARDIMAEAMLRIDARGYRIVLSVHDELLAEQPRGSKPVVEFENAMSELPAWATGCPVAAAGWVGERYRK